MKTWSGLEAPLAPDFGTVSLLDVVVHLGRHRRFGSAGSLEWTVLHHSVLVALLWIRAGYPAGELHFALLHDGHEYVTGDIPGPVKLALRRHLGDPHLPDYLDPVKKLEHEIDVRIRTAVGLLGQPDEMTRRRIKVCDLAALVVEGTFFGAPGCDCSVDVPASMEAEVYGLIAKAFPDAVEIATNHDRMPFALRRTRRG